MKKIIASFFGVRSPFLWFSLAIGLLLFSKNLLISRFILFIWMLSYVGLLFEKTWINNQETPTLLLDALLTPYHKKRTLISYSVLLSSLYACLSSLMMFSYITLYNQEALTSDLPLKSLLFEDYMSSIIVTVLLTVLSISNHFIERSYAKFLFNVANILLFLCYALKLNSSIILSDLGISIVVITGLSLYVSLTNIANLKKKKKEKPEKKQKKEPEFVVGNNIKGILTLSKMNIVAEKEVLNSVWTGMTSFSTYFIIRTIFTIIEVGTVSSGLLTNWIFVVIVLCIISAISSTRKIVQIYDAKNMLKIVPVQPYQRFKACVITALTPVVTAQGIAALFILLLLNFFDAASFFMTSHPLEQILHLMALAIFPISTFLICLHIHFSKDRTLTIIKLIAAFVVTMMLYFGLREALQIVIPLKMILVAFVWVIPYLLVIPQFEGNKPLHQEVQL